MASRTLSTLLGGTATDNGCMEAGVALGTLVAKSCIKASIARVREYVADVSSRLRHTSGTFAQVVIADR
jgi:hypothetical protein